MIFITLLWNFFHVSDVDISIFPPDLTVISSCHISVTSSQSHLADSMCALKFKGAYIKYVEGGVGGDRAEGFANFQKKIRSPGDHRPKYFMAQ